MRLSIPVVFATLCLVVPQVYAQDAKTDSSPCHADKNSTQKCQPDTAVKAPAPVVLQKSATHKAEKKGHHSVHSNKEVHTAQLDLAKLGYKVGHPDGVMGRRTATAVKKYQKANHLPVTGKVTVALIHHLDESIQHHTAKK